MSNLADRFTGGDFPFAFDTGLEKRYLALSSVRYLISDTEYGWSPKWLDEIVDQHRNEKLWGFDTDVFQIGDQMTRTVRVLFQHPPSSRVSYKTVIDPRAPVFEAIAVIKKGAFPNTDGAGFRLELKDGDRIETLFEGLLDPRNVPADRNGRAFRADLSRFTGREVELLFSTDPGPAGNASADWAGWGELRFVPNEEAAQPFKKIYDKEVRVYQVPWVLPRAALYDATEILPDSEVLGRLKDPAFDPNLKVVLSRESVPAEQEIASLGTSAGTPVRPATIVEYRSRYVRIKADSPAPALLVLNDTNFPGWGVSVNRRPAPIVNANYLFRGVFVPSGTSVVEFRYEPRSFYAGVGASFAAVVILAGLMLCERQRRRYAGT